MTDPEHEIEPGGLADDARPEPAEPETTTDAVVEQGRRRPPDLVGTRPEWNPEGLLPQETPRAATGRLWAPADDRQDDERGDAEAIPASATASASATAAPDAGPVSSRYSARFQFLLGALLAVGAAAVALLIAVLAGGQANDTVVVRDGGTWSSWRPTATGLDAAEQIANHVGRQYRLPDGKQLVLVEGGAMEIADLPVTIAIQQPASKGGDIDLVDDGVGVMYRLCGFNANSISTNCKIASGKPSVNRAMLLRREALELALYSFRYLGVSETVVLLPPTVDSSARTATATSTTTSTAAPPTALLFRRSQLDVQQALAHPLNDTLSKKTPSVNGVAHAPDTGVVRELTQTKAYRFKFQESNQDARAYLLLAPILLR